MAYEKLHHAQAAAFTDVFVHHIMPYVLTSPQHLKMWTMFARDESLRQIVRDTMKKK